MEANDLMIGDWYAFRGHPYKCTASDIASIAECEEKGAPTDISEIPLTPEILEKNGFVRSKVFVEWKYENDNVYMIYKPFPYLKIQMEDCIVAFPCEYVHQLQHALCLCGIEKEIEL